VTFARAEDQRDDDGERDREHCRSREPGSRPVSPDCRSSAATGAGLRREEVALLAGVSVDYGSRL
jgi:hypothetical protein